MTKQGKLKRIAGSVVSKGLSAVDKVAPFEKVDQVTSILRIKICEGNSCGAFIEKSRQCAECGCKMDLKVTMVSSPFTGELIKCPKNLW